LKKKRFDLKKYSGVFSLLLVAALTAGIVFWLRPSDSKRIKKRFQQACSTLAKSPGENPAMSAFKMFDFSSLCADSVSFEIADIPFRGALSNETLLSELTRSRALCEQIKIEPLDIVVDIPTSNHASAECVVKAKIKGASFDFEEIRHFKIRLQKIDNSWKFTAISDDQVLVR
jgi:hypothetical protein